MGEPAELDTKRRIYRFVESSPGIHFRGIQRVLDLSVGQLDYHLNEMAKNGSIIKVEQQGNTRYFPKDTMSKEERVVMGFLRKEITRNILLFLSERPGSTPNDILEMFNFSGPNLSYHLRRMVKAGVLEAVRDGRKQRYNVTLDEELDRLLVVYRATIFDKVVDRLS